MRYCDIMKIFVSWNPNVMDALAPSSAKDLPAHLPLNFSYIGNPCSQFALQYYYFSSASPNVWSSPGAHFKATINGCMWNTSSQTDRLFSLHRQLQSHESALLLGLSA